jgi:glycosyltransferase involved in cell wall biosynthesis
MTADRPLRVLFLVEGNTDIRFVVGLSEICDLTMAAPARFYGPSGLRDRVAASGATLTAVEIPGGRLAWQARSLLWLLRNAGRFDVILAQEVLRGALNANLAGVACGVPVVTYMGIDPPGYWRCRRTRGQVSWAKWAVGDAVIRGLMAVNGRLAARALAMGAHLRGVAKRYCPRAEVGLYYGIDTTTFCPATPDERAALRAKRGLPAGRFLVFFSSRISHEKDPETVLRAVSLVRQQGIDAVVLNLGGGYKEFIELATKLNLPDPSAWVVGGPALHPMTEVMDAFRAADAMALASLAEGLGLSPLEALSCGTPVVATAVGGMAVQLPGLARLVPPEDAEAMARELAWVYRNPDAARAEAVRARESHVVPVWDRARAFRLLKRTLAEVAGRGRP